MRVHKDVSTTRKLLNISHPRDNHISCQMNLKILELVNRFIHKFMTYLYVPYFSGILYALPMLRFLGLLKFKYLIFKGKKYTSNKFTFGIWLEWFILAGGMAMWWLLVVGHHLSGSHVEQMAFPYACHTLLDFMHQPDEPKSLSYREEVGNPLILHNTPTHMQPEQGANVEIKYQDSNSRPLALIPCYVSCTNHMNPKA